MKELKTLLTVYPHFIEAPLVRLGPLRRARRKARRRKN
jgi:hypothetical protein